MRCWPEEQPGLSQEAPSSTEVPVAVAEGGGDAIIPTPAVGSTERVVKTLLQSQAAWDDQMEQTMMKQD